MLETELAASEAKTHDEMSALTQKHCDELQRFRDENQQLAETICELEESLNRATNKVKEYKAEISSLQRSLAGQLITFIVIHHICSNRTRK